MKCGKYGCEDFEEVSVSIPWAWEPNIGVIKQHETYLKCKKCGTPQSSEGSAD